MDGCRYLESSISMLISDITITSLCTTLLNMPFLCRFTYVRTVCRYRYEDDDDSDDNNDDDDDSDGDNVSDDNVSDDNDVDDDSSTYGCHYMDAYICSLKSFIHRN